VIQFFKIAKQYGDRILFSESTFTLGRGERCGLVGRNGSGKSTLFNLILGSESLDGGSISVPKHYRIGTLEQHIRFSKQSIIEESLSLLPPEKREEYRAEIILTGLGFSLDDMQKDPKTLSGGFQLRLQLTKALLAEPDCLLLDEPTNYLDIVAIRWLEEFLKQWPGELILVSHDRAFLDRVVTHTIGIYRNQVHKLNGTTEKFYEHMLLQDEIHEQTRQRTEKKRAHMQDFVDRFGAKATKASQAQSRMKSLEKIPVLEKLATMENLNFSFKMARFPAKKMLELDGVGFSYDKKGEKQAFSVEDISIEVHKGDRIAIIGKNGRGKSTILSLMAGLLQPKNGRYWASENLKIGHFGQTNIDRLHPDHTIEEEIAQANPDMAYGELRNVCGVMMFSGDDAKKKISVLSGGERSRVLLGKILASPCNLLLLDEPTHHLDMESIEALMHAIKSFSGAVILVTHDEGLLERFGEHMLVCRRDAVTLFDGTYPLFLEKEGWEDDLNTKTSAKSEPKKISKKQSKNRIKECEQAIVEAEKAVIDAEKKLQEASDIGDMDAITEQSEAIGALHTSIEKLFAELEKLHQ